MSAQLDRRRFLGLTGAAGLTLETLTKDPEWATIDPAKIEQAVENLVSNAIKYTPSLGRVLLTVTGSEDHVEIAVSDTGVGMTPDEIKQAFEPFWRGQHAHREAVQGIGIGLGFVRDICDAHHAAVTITSEPGEGTTATIRLPRRH